MRSFRFFKGCNLAKCLSVRFSLQRQSHLGGNSKYGSAANYSLKKNELSIFFLSKEQNRTQFSSVANLINSSFMALFLIYFEQCLCTKSQLSTKRLDTLKSMGPKSAIQELRPPPKYSQGTFKQLPLSFIELCYVLNELIMSSKKSPRKVSRIFYCY